jgi:lysine-arginine-ornithine-binding protein
MKKLTLAVIAAALMSLAAGAVGAAPSAIRIGTEGAFPPFNYIDADGTVKGVDIDIANALCKAMEVECTFVTQDWDGIIPGLMVRKYDAIVAAMSITEERKKRIAFTKPYFQTPIVYVAKLDSGVEISPEGLKGKTVGVQRGTVSANYLEQNYADVVNIQYYDTQENANLDLTSGRVDVLLADQPVMQIWIKDSGDGKFDLVGEPISDPAWIGEGFGIALRQDEEELLAMFNKAIDQINADGTYKKIYDSWFGE